MATISRQVRRHQEREQAKKEAAGAKLAARYAAKRALLARQSAREKAGAYGRPVAASITPSRSRPNTRLVQKGKPFGRVVKTSIDGREYQYHATKGWRSYRAA